MTAPEDEADLATIPAACRDHWYPRRSHSLQSRRIRIVTLMVGIALLLPLFIEVAERGFAAGTPQGDVLFIASVVLYALVLPFALFATALGLRDGEVHWLAWLRRLVLGPIQRWRANRIPDTAITACALLMIDRHGPQALGTAHDNAATARWRGQEGARVVWERVGAAIGAVPTGICPARRHAKPGPSSAD